MKKILLITLLILPLVFSFAPVPVSAADGIAPGQTPKSVADKATQSFLRESGFNILNPAKGEDARLYVVALVRVALSFVGFLFFLLVFYGGYFWLTAGGSEDQIKKAKLIITRALIGFAVVLAAYSVTAFVATLLSRAALPEGYVAEPKQ